MTNNVDNYNEQPAGGSTDNKLVLGGSVETGDGENIKKTFLNVRITDISTAGSVFVVAPVAGNFTKIYSVIDGAITTGDAVITTEINTVLVTDGGLTIANASSAAGDVDSGTPSAANTVAVGDVIEVITDGGSTNTVSANFTIEITRS